MGLRAVLSGNTGYGTPTAVAGPAMMGPGSPGPSFLRSRLLYFFSMNLMLSKLPKSSTPWLIVQNEYVTVWFVETA